MTSSVIPVLEELLAAAAVAVVVLGAATVAAALWLRRRWRRIKAHVSGHSRGLAFGTGSGGWQWLWSRPLPNRQWVSIHQTRRRLARARAAAEHSVALARSSGAPLGDLESLCRRLRPATLDVDRSLRVAQRATGSLIDTGVIMRQADDLTTSACYIQNAAAMAMTGASAPTTSDLVYDIHREVGAIAGGIAHAGQHSSSFEPWG